MRISPHKTAIFMLMAAILFVTYRYIDTRLQTRDRIVEFGQWREIRRIVRAYLETRHIDRVVSVDDLTVFAKETNHYGGTLAHILNSDDYCRLGGYSTERDELLLWSSHARLVGDELVYSGITCAGDYVLVTSPPTCTRPTTD